MRKNINLILIPLLLLSFFAFSGFDCEEGGIELRVIGTDGGFTGYCIVIKDGDKNERFFEGRTADAQGFYVYSRNLGTFKQVEISVTKDKPTSTMDIYLYNQNGDIIQKVNNASCEAGGASTITCTNSSTMSYTFTSTGSP